MFLVPSVGFSVAGLDHTKFSFYQFQSFCVYCCHSNIDLLKTTFSQFSIHSQVLVVLLVIAIEQGKNRF